MRKTGRARALMPTCWFSPQPTGVGRAGPALMQPPRPLLHVTRVTPAPRDLKSGD